MSLNRKLSLFIIIISALGLHGCALMLSKNKQKVTIHSATPGATIYHMGDSVGVGTAIIKANKGRLFESVRVEKEGYKSKTQTFGLTKLSPAYIASILDIWFYGPFFMQKIPRLRKFNKVQEVAAMTPLQNRLDSEKYVYINKVSIDTKEEDIRYKNYYSYKKYLAGTYIDKGKKTTTQSKKAAKKSDKSNDLKVDNTIFTDELNASLVKMNFVDTNNKFFRNTSNSLFINAIIKKVSFHEVFYISPTSGLGAGYSYSRMLAMDLEIEWEILNYYKEKIYTIQTKQKSDPFQFNTRYYSGSSKNTVTEIINKAVQDNMEYSFLQVRKQLVEQKLLTKTREVDDTVRSMTINRGNVIAAGKLNDYLKGTVSIKVDEGHGSGVIISSEGYIVTNYHVIANTKKIEVIYNDGSKEEATVVRKSAEGDVALLKVARKDLSALPISELKDTEIGIDVWAIGTPRSLELGQSVSKGIISGLRKTDNVTYVQTDVKISPGNSGGALVNKEGLVLGIVTSKVMSVGTEGIGFAVIGGDLMEKLKIKFAK